MRTTTTRACMLVLTVILAACSGGAAPTATPSPPPTASPQPSTVFFDAPRTFEPSRAPSPTPAPSMPSTTLTPPASPAVASVLEPAAEPDASPAPSSQEFVGKAVTVPANGSVTVPVTFEGSDRGAVTLILGDKDKVTARFARKQLVPFGSVPPVRTISTGILTSPKDGMLRISNSAGKRADVGLMVSFLSDRHLVVRTVTFAPAGAAIAVRVSMTRPLPGDDPTAELVDASGAVSPIDLAPDGPDRWKAVVHPATAGENRIQASVKGSRPRVGGTQFQVGAEGAAFGSAVAEAAVDSDGNGLVDALVLTPTVTVPTGGSYTVVSTLLDSTGKVIDHGRVTATLVAGVPTAMAMEFPGRVIHDAGRPGPYRLTGLILIEEESLDWAATLDDAGATAAYALADFEP